MKRLLLFTVLLVLATPGARAVSFYLSPDAPADLGGITRFPWDIVRKDNPGPYTATLSLPGFTAIDGLHRLDSGDWLISVEAPADLGPATWDPRDVFRSNGAIFAPFFCGDAAGVPLGSNVDAVFMNGGDGGNLVIGFDVPTQIGALTVRPGDLLELMKVGAGCAGWSPIGLYFDASITVPPIEPSTNTTGGDRRAIDTVVPVDVPTTLGPMTVLPGQLIGWNGGIFSSFFADPAWPPMAHMGDFAFLADPGIVPVTMTVTRLVPDGSLLRIDWSASCSAGAEDYGIYEGALGTWYSHTQVDCSDSGADLMEDIGTTSGNRYYLVAAHNPNDEGSYGTDSAGAEIPVGALVCQAPQVLGPCP